MSGTYIDSSYSVDIINVYKYFSDYFENPQLKKIKTMPTGFGLYACQVKSHLAKDRRYIFVFIHSTEFSGDTCSLSDVKWNILQTRTIPEIYSVPICAYNTFKNIQGDTTEIFLDHRGDTEYKYKSKRDPFTSLAIILLLSKNQTQPYSDVANIKTAIENYNTIFAISN